MPHIEQLVDSLPGFLRERLRLLGTQAVNPHGEYVLYWMHSAVRAWENPALSTAIELGNRLQLPVVVYQGLSPRYRYASDRHHTFILEGARDVQVALAQRGICYLLNVERQSPPDAPPGKSPAHLAKLARQAAVVATEDMPVSPLRQWIRSLSRQIACSLIAVDTACVVPMRVVGQAYDRAFEFREATKTQYESRIPIVPEEPQPLLSDYSPLAVPFEAIDLQQAKISEVVAACEIDHSIGPVAHTRGGSLAGYQRWDAFKKNGITKYAQSRNNALVDGVSRLSAYLHYGMVSPTRIAREAAAIQHAGAEKFLDELLIWRELAYAFCYYHPEHARLSALPAWARVTLDQHARDRRPHNYSWETLARAQTGDVLWNAAQRSLLLHGELHNNVRMTWGKSILHWTPSAKHALATLIDLNHRFALDGRDPASYGGILWCLGQFDRPFLPERSILGTIRDRTTEQHALRLNPQAYRQKITRSLPARLPKVAIVGAGISGLICARTLADHGLSVTVFEKSKRVGGRMATRRTEQGHLFDHGAQYFTVRDRRFGRYVDSWIQDGLVEQWHGRIVSLEHGQIQKESGTTRRLIGVSGMNTIAQHIASDLNVRHECKVAPLDRSSNDWTLQTEAGEQLGTFDIAIVSAPAPQTADILHAVPHLSNRARDATMQACWAVMLATKAKSLGTDFDAAFVSKSPVSWIARNNRQPGWQQAPETWLIHASADWSQQHIHEPIEWIERTLVREFWKAIGQLPTELQACNGHLWRYAIPQSPLPDHYLFDSQLRIGACGDWCAGPRVEGAFLSGMSVAGHVLRLIHDEALIGTSSSGRQLELF